MNKTLLAVVLLLVGGVLLYVGTEREDSLSGRAESVGHEVASAVDGKPRFNDHTLYFVGGGVMILAGIVVALRRI